MTRRNWLLLAVLVAVLGIVAIVNFSHQQQAAQPGVDMAAYKAAFVEAYLKQANDAALQQNKPFNEEQKRALRSICSCAADRLVTEFSTAELIAYQANPTDPAKLARVKEFLQSCAAQTTMPATNP